MSSAASTSTLPWLLAALAGGFAVWQTVAGANAQQLAKTAQAQRVAAEAAAVRARDAAAPEIAHWRSLSAWLLDEVQRARTDGGGRTPVAAWLGDLAARAADDPRLLPRQRPLLLGRCAELFLRHGEADRAAAALRALLATAGPDLPAAEALLRRVQLAQALQQQGDLDGAERELAAATAARAAVSAEEPVQITLDRRRALQQLARGDAATAASALRDVLRRRRARFSEETAEVAEVAVDLVNALIAAERPEEALPAAEGAVVTCTRAHGTTGEPTLAMRHAVATLLARRGDREAARAQLEALLGDAERALGADHPRTAAIRLSRDALR